MRDSDDERPTDAHGVVDASSIDDDELEGDGETVTTVSNDHLRNGTDVGGYLIDGELGSGGMGVVYSATHPVIGKRAAVKVLKPELSDNPAAVERFMMEARAVNQIGHPNIVDIFAFGKLTDGRSYYVMDLLNGEPLRRQLKRGGPLHPAEAIAIIDETASALMAAHDKGIIHRDLKPDNVFMVSAPGRWPEVRILDWGLLKLTSQQSAVSSSKYRTLAGSVMGTPVYMSPEQARASDAVDFRTDVYSLGVMSYELLAGVVPFKKGSSIDTLLAHQDEPVPPLADKCPSLPIELVQLIEAMLAKEPDERPTLAAVRAVIKRLRGTKIPTMTAAGLTMPEPAPPTPRLFVEPATDPATGPRTPYVEPPTSPALPPSTSQPRSAAPSNNPFAEPPTSPALPPSTSQPRSAAPSNNPFAEPPTSPALPPSAAFVEPPTINTRPTAEATVPRLPPSNSQLPAIGRAPTPPSVGRAPTPPTFGRSPTPSSIDRTPTPGSPSIVGNLSAPPSLGRTPTSPPVQPRTQTPPGGIPRPGQTAPPLTTPRTRTPPGGIPRPTTPAGGMPRSRTAPPDSRNAATTPPPMRAQALVDRKTPPGGLPLPAPATTPPPMRGQAQLDRKPTTPPGGLPLPAPPRSERMQTQPDPELANQSMNSLPYQSMNVAPSTLAGHGMPGVSSQSMPSQMPIASQGMPNQMPIANQGMPNQMSMPGPGTPSHMPIANPGMPNQMMPNQMAHPGMPAPGMAPGSYGSIPPQYPSYPQITRQPTGTPQAMTATSGSRMKRVLVIAIAAIVVSGIGIAIVMLT